MTIPIMGSVTRDSNGGGLVLRYSHPFTLAELEELDLNLVSQGEEGYTGRGEPFGACRVRCLQRKTSMLSSRWHGQGEDVQWLT